MYSELELKAFKVIDNFLLDLEKSNKSGHFKVYNVAPEVHLAKEIIDRHNLLTYRNPGDLMSLCNISQNGLKVNIAGGIQKYLSLIH